MAGTSLLDREFLREDETGTVGNTMTPTIMAPVLPMFAHLAPLDIRDGWRIRFRRQDLYERDTVGDDWHATLPLRMISFCLTDTDGTRRSCPTRYRQRCG
jgi:hypothetical protein